MDYKQRGNVTEILACQAKILQTLEVLLENIDADTVARMQLIKLQSDQVHWQNRFLRLVYLSGEVTGE